MERRAAAGQQAQQDVIYDCSYAGLPDVIETGLWDTLWECTTYNLFSLDVKCTQIFFFVSLYLFLYT